jgi:hypothetical protein
VETFVDALEGDGSGDLGIVEVGLANGGTGLEDNRNEELDESGEGELAERRRTQVLFGQGIEERGFKATPEQAESEERDGGSAGKAVNEGHGGRPWQKTRERETDDSLPELCQW